MGPMYGGNVVNIEVVVQLSWFGYVLLLSPNLSEPFDRLTQKLDRNIFCSSQINKSFSLSSSITFKYDNSNGKMPTTFFLASQLHMIW